MPLAEMPEWQIGTRVPRVSVRALAFDGGQLIAVESSTAPGKLHLPGGGVAHGETMREAVQRELREELGVGAASADYQLSIENLFDTHLGVYHCVEHVFMVTLDGVPRAAEAHLRLHRLELATIGRAPLFPTAFRDLLARRDWRDHRYLLAGKFAGDC